MDISVRCRRGTTTYETNPHEPRGEGADLCSRIERPCFPSSTSTRWAALGPPAHEQLSIPPALETSQGLSRPRPADFRTTAHNDRQGASTNASSLATRKRGRINFQMGFCPPPSTRPRCCTTLLVTVSLLVLAVVQVLVVNISRAPNRKQ